MPDDNPFQSPQTTNAPAKVFPRYSAWRMAVGVLLLVGMVPASAVAFLCCCLAAVAAAERPGQPGPEAALTAGVIAGLVGGVVAFALMLMGGIYLIRRSKQAPTA